MPITVSPVPTRDKISDGPVGINRTWSDWFRDLRQRVLDSTSGAFQEFTISASDLDGAGIKVLIQSSAKESFKIRDIILSGSGTNFGAGGNRNISIQDRSGTHTYTTIPNATIESLTAGRWGSTAVPLPTGSDVFAASTLGEDIIAKYTGGTSDHSGVGSLTLMIRYERIT
jgi:hypothetical protein